MLLIMIMIVYKYCKADDYDKYDNNEVISNAYVNDNDCMISMKLIKVISVADDCREDLCRARTYTQENSVVQQNSRSRSLLISLNS